MLKMKIHVNHRVYGTTGPTILHLCLSLISKHYYVIYVQVTV